MRGITNTEPLELAEFARKIIHSELECVSRPHKQLQSYQVSTIKFLKKEHLNSATKPCTNFHTLPPRSTALCFYTEYTMEPIIDTNVTIPAEAALSSSSNATDALSFWVVYLQAPHMVYNSISLLPFFLRSPTR